MARYSQIFVATLTLGACWAWDDTILEPISGKTGEPVAFLFGQGAGIATSAYEPIGRALQEAVPFPLWFGVPQCLSDTAAIPTTLASGMKRIKKTMYSDGMNENITTFFGGHSLGGAEMPDYVKGNEPGAAGMILMGSFLTRKFKTGATAEGRPQVEFPVPVLTIGAELDGLCRISRIAEALYTQVSFAGDPASAVHSLPVTTIAGMNHMQFASGTPTSRVAKFDLVSEITEDAAHAAVAADSAAFMGALLDIVSWSSIESRAATSTAAMKPITDSLELESYTHFLPPCYCETEDEYGYLQYGTCLSSPNCSGGVRWTEQASMDSMAGASDLGIMVQNTDSIHLVTEEKPSCHLPHIHGNPVNNANPGNGDTLPICELSVTEAGQCTLVLTSVTQPLYKNDGLKDLQDTGTDPIASLELRSKLKSRQSVQEAAGFQNVSFDVTDATVSKGGTGDRCAEINQKSIDWAYAALSSSAQARYDMYGQKLQVGPDLTTCAAGPCWINADLVFKTDDTTGTATVQGTMMGTENYNKYPCGEDALLPCATGFHYCKLLSPARAVEWMMVDGLRLYYTNSTKR